MQAARALFFGELPGNIRELERALSSAAILMGDGPIDISHSSILQARAGSSNAAQEASPAEAEGEASASRQKRPARAIIEAASSRANGRQGEAARLLGVHERQLARWMDAYGIPRGKKSASGA